MRINEFKLIRYGKFTDRTLHLPRVHTGEHAPIRLESSCGRALLEIGRGVQHGGFSHQTPQPLVRTLESLGVLHHTGGQSTAQTTPWNGAPPPG